MKEEHDFEVDLTVGEIRAYLDGGSFSESFEVTLDEAQGKANIDNKPVTILITVKPGD